MIAVGRLREVPARSQLPESGRGSARPGEALPVPRWLCGPALGVGRRPSGAVRQGAAG